MNEKEKLLYLSGFMDCIVYQYYMSLTEEEKEVWCEERQQRIIEQYLYLFEDFLKFQEKTLDK